MGGAVASELYIYKRMETTTVDLLRWQLYLDQLIF